jgi:restriction-modification enzyme MmeI-like protein
MFELSEVIHQQGYSDSPHFFDLGKVGALEQIPVQGACLLREARAAGLRGVYTFETQRDSTDILWSRRIAVGLAEATADGEQAAEAAARRLHRSVWNLGTVPFLVVVLPHQVRLYSGFSYSDPAQTQDHEFGLLDTVERLQRLRNELGELRAEAIDSREVWSSRYGRQLDSESRVDRSLLKALQTLGRDLREEEDLLPEVGHSLIGKYIYLRYLWDRGILDDGFLRDQGLRREEVFGRNATRKGLSQLVTALEKRFNGKIFPLAFDRGDVKNLHVRRVASALLGDAGDQIHLPFRAYDFKHIPVEMLSMIYEQFLRWDTEEEAEAETEEAEPTGEREEPTEQETRAQKSGVVYTPVFLADYVLSEAERVRPLEPGMRVLDPACGSGVFLVLAFRRLIESRYRQLGRGLTPPELKQLLTQSIFGIEREAAACAVAEFSLLLTLLHYCDPPDLLGRKDFQFPSLRGRNILEENFFDVDPLPEDVATPGAHQCPKVDLVLGNPPWIELSSRKKDAKDEGTRRWIARFGGRAKHRVTGNRVAEAFSQRVTDFLRPGADCLSEGVIALLLPATSLFNAESKAYRQDLFVHKEVLRITDFANLREVLFGRKTEHPAASIVYRLRRKDAEPADILHLAPLGIHQIGRARTQPWALTIYEEEICSVPHSEAELGESVLWKLALWGTPRDAQALRRLERIFPSTLGKLCEERRGWTIAQGPELRSKESPTGEKLISRADLLEHQRLDSTRQTQSLLSFSVPEAALVPNLADRLRRGRAEALKLTSAPHVVISRRWLSYLAFSDRPFIVPPQKIGLAAPSEDADYLRALSIFLCSSLVAYHLFFYSTEWGTFRRARYVTLSDVRSVPVPELSSSQVLRLAAVQKRIALKEQAELRKWLTQAQRELFGSTISTRDVGANLLSLKRDRRSQALKQAAEIREQLIHQIDAEVFEIFKISRDLEILIREWRTTRLPLDRAITAGQVTREPFAAELLGYAEEIQQQLDSFVTGQVHHRVRLTQSPTLVECKIEQRPSETPFPVSSTCVQTGDLTVAGLLSGLTTDLRQKLSQWVYVQRGIRLFEGDTIYLYKPARLIDWTRTQAMIDATEIIAAVIDPKAD